nr:isochorismatase family cysteine hydrolase [Caballeronia sp. dw_19]
MAVSRSALVIVDLQNDFCATGGYIHQLGKDVAAYRSLIEPVERVLQVARTASVPVIWLRASYENESITPGMLAKKQLMGVQAECCVPGTWGYEYFGPAPVEGESVFDKHTYSGFSNASFDVFLQVRNVETLVFCGVQTNVCVESTLRDAHSRSYYVALVRDGVASHTKALHDATLANVGFLFGDVLAADELAALWEVKREI